MKPLRRGSESIFGGVNMRAVVFIRLLVAVLTLDQVVGVDNPRNLILDHYR